MKLKTQLILARLMMAVGVIIVLLFMWENQFTKILGFTILGCVFGFYMGLIGWDRD